MRDKIQKILVCLWMAAMAGSRIVYLFVGTLQAADPHGYYEQAMVQTGVTSQILVQGMELFYVKCLSVLFLFVGNRPEAAVVWQILLQIFWLLLLYVGLRLLFGKNIGLVLAAVLSFLPWIFETTFTFSTLNLLLLFASAALCLAGAICKCIRKRKGPGAEQMEDEKMDDGKIKEVSGESPVDVPKEEPERKEAEDMPVKQAETEPKPKPVKQFDNPLPLPKKHVKKELDFDHDVALQDFDHKISEQDDFDH